MSRRKQPIQYSGPMKRWRCKDQDAFLFPEMSDNPWATASGKRKGLKGGHTTSGLTTVELCAGAGGQALGLEQAGLAHAALVEIDRHACATLRLNRPTWNVIEQDLHNFEGARFA